MSNLSAAGVDHCALTAAPRSGGAFTAVASGVVVGPELVVRCRRPEDEERPPAPGLVDVEPLPGFEPGTYGLRNRCSTPELQRQGRGNWYPRRPGRASAGRRDDASSGRSAAETRMRRWA